jgi:RNA polymerase sporulation-specific sigma factor
MDKEDLYQVGVIGLINAYNNYDFSKNVKFSTYAFPYIVGEVSRYIRENKVLKISRDLVRLGRKINEYINKHLEVRGYKPTIKEISKTLGVKEEKIISALDSCNIVKSLDEELNDDGKIITLLDITEDKAQINKDTKMDLLNAFNFLDEDEKELIINRYYNDFTQSEIANMLGVNQVYVSRMEKKALTKMKVKMM